MVTDQSDSKRWNPLPSHELLFLISSKGSFYMHHSTYRIAHTMVFVTPVVERGGGREIYQWVHHEGSIRWPIVPWADVLPRSYISLLEEKRLEEKYSVTNSETDIAEYRRIKTKRHIEGQEEEGRREIAHGSTPWRIDPATHRTTSGRSTTELHLAPRGKETRWEIQRYRQRDRQK